MMENCRICNSPAEVQGIGEYNSKYNINCPVCGLYSVSKAVEAGYLGQLNDIQDLGSKLQHALYKMRGITEVPFITSELFEKIKSDSSPTPKEQANNLILYLGANTKPGIPYYPTPSKIRPIIGSLDDQGSIFVIDSLIKGNLLSTTQTLDSGFYLTMRGWEKYEELQRAVKDSRLAFMAMPFGKPEIDELCEKFKAAVVQTGFTLRRLDDAPTAGLIDNRLRLEIRKSRFLVADLTYENRGAYWEAGYAEGLGLPVFYTCEKTFFDKNNTHFDTNHHHTIFWTLETIEEAVEQLKVAIRITLYDEAKQEDREAVLQ